MKNIIAMIIFLTLGGQVVAASFSSLSIGTSSQIPIKVLLDGQLFSENRPIASQQNILPGDHELKVFYIVQDFFGPREELLFFGKIFLPKNTFVYAQINEYHEFVVLEEKAIRPTPVYNNIHHQNQQHYFDNAYSTKPINANKPTFAPPTYCGFLPPQEYVAAPASIYPMSKEAFYRLKTTIKNQTFSNAKKNIFNQALLNNHFNSKQVKELIDLFTFSNDRLYIAQNAYQKTLDKENYFLVYDSLKWSSSIKQLNHYITSL